MIDRATLKAHIDYTAWASARLVGVAAQLSEAELTRDFGTADRSVLGTLVHVYAADRVWLGRMVGKPPTVLVDPAMDMHLSVLQTEWPSLLARWKDYLDSVEDTDMPIHYTALQGTPFTNSVWQIVLHLVNHGTHHRGQVSGFLRAMGRTPPPLDLIAYYRLQANAGS